VLGVPVDSGRFGDSGGMKLEGVRQSPPPREALENFIIGFDKSSFSSGVGG